MELRYLNNNEYPAWDKLVGHSSQGNVFCRSWWLEAVGGVKVLGCFDKGRLVAGIPLFEKKKYWLRICTMPILSATWGVILEPMASKKAKALSREIQIQAEIAKYLSKELLFRQSFSPNLLNWLPFYWEGFKQTTRFTYVLEDLSNRDALWGGLRANIRTDIRKAERNGVKIVTCSPDEALCLFQQTRDRQGRKSVYSREYFMQLYEAAYRNNSGACFAAYDTEGRAHAGAFLVWDSSRAFYLAGGGDPKLRNSGATSLLIWKMIEFSAAHSAVFDFEGSVVPSIERFFRAFGAKLTPYNVIMKFPASLKLFF